ncbi:M15 family metallopeptidase [Asticcacaulis sp. 201]|uniref:M15 family metallopeptidase n=1 Tax=Asticcacaulis sp. 201 TaxID=3028787 RepID=UPI002916C4D2|nr:M15 family metallopeptidase [Asticcacaulis sp. 201]MDV6332046.1 M15 family metallopeptidase [Asticcacaulis sp. 201]
MVALTIVTPLIACSLNRTQDLVLSVPPMMPSSWPHVDDCRSAYGDPTGAVGGASKASAEWEADNLVTVRLPWHAHAAWNSKLAITGLQVHRLAAPSLTRIVATLWLQAGKSQAEIDRVGLSAIGGGYNFRPVRDGGRLSTHAYGCAVDFDPNRNALGDGAPNFALAENRYVVNAFRTEGWRWGGGWLRPDGMHFEAARLARGR